jgi:hypothetical protein
MEGILKKKRESNERQPNGKATNSKASFDSWVRKIIGIGKHWIGMSWLVKIL